MKNPQLVPQIVMDIVESIKSNRNSFVRENYIMRLEAIVEYCQIALAKVKQDQK